MGKDSDVLYGTVSQSSCEQLAGCQHQKTQHFSSTDALAEFTLLLRPAPSRVEVDEARLDATRRERTRENQRRGARSARRVMEPRRTQRATGRKAIFHEYKRSNKAILH